MGLSTSLNTAVSAACNATQVGIGVVSQNVANAGTAGYVRRTVVNTLDSLSAAMTVGTSEHGQVQRLLDRIVQHQLWQESFRGRLYVDAGQRALQPRQALWRAGQLDGARFTIYSAFTNSLQALQNDPSSYANLHSQVIDAASHLARRLNTPVRRRPDPAQPGRGRDRQRCHPGQRAAERALHG
jgi:flagellar hook-associated protein 1 FlgK